ncbi:hypothetical protein SAMN05444141_103367 [Pseudovibrio denitrificans]|uniref:Uncharacterized protein n=1 Tax=Pseudovibrio denitrificans TaxID=258256 RepID=A0A1I7AUA7_9HYPH|nr:hypothetical protein SAMN05444141_103367 [Pseudovibrio denitrificans]
MVKDVVVGTPACSWQRPCLDGGCNLRRLQVAELHLAGEGAVIVEGVWADRHRAAEAVCRKGVARGAQASVFCHFHFGQSP